MLRTPETIEKYLEKYNKSNDEGIKQAKLFLSTGILLIQMANERLETYIETVLNNPKLMLKQGTVTKTMAEIMENSNDAWLTYARTTATGVTFALTDTPRNLKDLVNAKPITNLLITQSEIDLLKSHLMASFGAVIKDNSQGKVADLPAVAMWSFLNDKWIPAPEH